MAGLSAASLLWAWLITIINAQRGPNKRVGYLTPLLYQGNGGRWRHHRLGANARHNFYVKHDLALGAILCRGRCPVGADSFYLRQLDSGNLAELLEILLKVAAAKLEQANGLAGRLEGTDNKMRVFLTGLLG